MRHVYAAFAVIIIGLVAVPVALAEQPAPREVHRRPRYPKQ